MPRARVLIFPLLPLQSENEVQCYLGVQRFITEKWKITSRQRALLCNILHLTSLNYRDSFTNSEDNRETGGMRGALLSIRNMGLRAYVNVLVIWHRMIGRGESPPFGQLGVLQESEAVDVL